MTIGFLQLERLGTVRPAVQQRDYIRVAVFAWLESIRLANPGLTSVSLDLFAYAERARRPEPPRYPIGIPADVCELFEKLSLDVAKTGRKRFSADMVLHRIRWYFTVERADEHFKINNNHSAVLARWFLRRHPQYDKFFELRVRRCEAGRV